MLRLEIKKRKKERNADVAEVYIAQRWSLLNHPEEEG